MLNICVFIFILYAMSYSVKAILFGKKRKNYPSAVNNTRKRRVASKANIQPIHQNSRKKSTPSIKINGSSKAA